MTKIYGALNYEKDLLAKAKSHALTLLNGTKNIRRYNQFNDNLSKYLEDISILPYGTKDSDLDNSSIGVCRCNYTKGTSNIKMYTIYPTNKQDELFLMHEFIHEICHAICNMLNHEYRPKVAIRNLKNGRRYFVRNNSGCIVYTDVSSNTSFEYGTMFTETFTDMFTTMALIAFNDYYPNDHVRVDDVLNRHISKWHGINTGYSIFTSITRLMCAAFNNIVDVNYEEILENGLSPFNIEGRTDTGRRVKVNDFMYGILYNPMSIEYKFDCLMGNEAYINLCNGMDTIFNEYLKNGKITRNMILEIRDFMATLTKFVYLKCDYNLELGIWTPDEARSFINNYSKIFRSLEFEYRSYFSENEINDLRRSSSIPLMVYLKSNDATIGQKVKAIRSTLFPNKRTY